jgi:hypothetical protein
VVPLLGGDISEGEGVWIPVACLSRALACTEPGPIDLAPIACEHGLADPKTDRSLVKLIPRQVQPLACLT